MTCKEWLSVRVAFDLNRIVLYRHSQDVADGAKYGKSFFMKQESCAKVIMLVGACWKVYVRHTVLVSCRHLCDEPT